MAQYFDDEESQRRFHEAGQKLRESMEPEVIEFMVAMTHMLGVLCAIEESGSMDPDTLANVMYEQKGHIIPVEEFRQIVIEQMPILIMQDLVTDEGLTEQGHFLALKHLELMQRSGQPPVAVQ